MRTTHDQRVSIDLTWSPQAEWPSTYAAAVRCVGAEIRDDLAQTMQGCVEIRNDFLQTMQGCAEIRDNFAQTMQGCARGCRKRKKKKLKVSNTPYLTKGPALRDTHNTVWAPRRLLKRPHPLFKGTIARSVRSHGPAMQAWYRALRDYGVCKWTSIQPLSTQSLSLASWLCTPLCPHHIETALWHCRHW